MEFIADAEISKNGKTNVVNVKVAHIRPKYNNLKEWMEDKNNIYVGRRGVVFVTDGENNKFRWLPRDSPFANPFTIDKKKNPEEERKRVIDAYKIYLNELLIKKPELKELLKTYKGKTLGCWCKPEPCHADILIEKIDSLEKINSLD